MTEMILDMDHDQSEALLAKLFDHAEKSEFIYSHKWVPGDLVIWDNRSVQHFAVHDYGTEKRTMRRGTGNGDEPY